MCLPCSHKPSIKVLFKLFQKFAPSRARSPCRHCGGETLLSAFSFCRNVFLSDKAGQGRLFIYNFNIIVTSARPMFSICLSSLFSLTPRAQRKKLTKKKRLEGTRSGLCPKNPQTLERSGIQRLDLNFNTWFARGRLPYK